MTNNINNYDFKVDYILPWVNPLDVEWQNSYLSAKGEEVKERDSRFRDWGYLKYVFRGIEKNMPWINKVHIILSSESQVPDWLNTEEVNVIYHKDYIPQEFLPTFNSSTIESFFPLLTGVEDHIIYGNDDVYPMNPMRVDDFFTSKGLPIISYSVLTETLTPFTEMCKRDFDLVRNMFPGTTIDKNVYYKQPHWLVAWDMNTLRRFYTKHNQKIIESSITQFRDNSKNYNQYVFTDYHILSSRSLIDMDKDLGVYENFINRTPQYMRHLMRTDKKILCINDSGSTNLDAIAEVGRCFELKFPEKSKYEK